ncbi:MAG: TorF family putative porin [Burkholderiales bacterium]
MKKIATPLMLAMSLAFAGNALAQAAPAAPESTMSFNVGGVNEYRYRGISQSRFDTALSGGADYADKSGVYVGVWGSSIKWIKDAGGKANTEVDYYGGYKFTVGDVGYDIGFLRYDYSGNALKPSANTNELYGAATMGPVTLKYSQSTGNLFGFANSKGSSYVDLTATFDLGEGYSLVPHLGYQAVKGAGNGIYSYTDTALTLGKDLGNGLAASAAIIGTNAKTGSYVSPAGKQLGKSGLVVGLKYSF